MSKAAAGTFRTRLFPIVAVISVIIFLAAMPHWQSAATEYPASDRGVSNRTESHDDRFPNYDIRTDKSATGKLIGFRSGSGRNAADIADVREEFVRGETRLRERVPTLAVEYSPDLRAPEVIAPDVKQGRAFLTAPDSAKVSERLRRFVRENSSLFGLREEDADGLRVTADYTNPDGNLSFAHLEQFIDGVPVFRGEVKAGFTKRGEMIRVINNLAPGASDAAVSRQFGDPSQAVRAAAPMCGSDADRLLMSGARRDSDDSKFVFGTTDSATVAEKIYFPTEPGVVIPAWRVLIWQPVNAYYIIVDADTGALLWRKNITEDQTQAATYGIYANPNAMINVAESPFPFTPGPVSPNGQQGAAISRSSVTRIGNEGLYSFNNNGWIPDGSTKTDGNNVQAGIDRDGVDGVDTNSEAVSATRNFVYNYNPFNPNTSTGDAPVPTPQTYPGSEFQQGSVTQLFYISNWYHDELYRLGFTEQARNFQDDNFGRGGLGLDRVRAEGQDSTGTNNANFSTPADGGRGRMQMYLWSAPNPDIDGNLDADVVIHELTHGLSNRLHGNGGGLSTNMARGMGEGWSDFYAHSLLSEPGDPLNGIYTVGGYDTYLLSGSINNYYYGIRRYPKSVIAFTGGANNKPHNAFTFSYVNSNCGARLTNANFAFGRGPTGSSTCDQVHNLGEVWSSMLWEIRARFVTRLGWSDGNRRMLQFVTDGMKLAPLSPTFIQERDAIVAAAQASLPGPQASDDVADIWEGFRLRGLGYSATISNAGSGTGDAVVTEAFDGPNLRQTPDITISDSTGDNDGYAEPGENILIGVPLSNNTGVNATAASVSVVGGGSVAYGTVVNNSTEVRQIPFTVPQGAACGSALNINIDITSSLGTFSVSRVFILGVPQATFSENFDSVTAPAFPAGWTAGSELGGQPFVNSTFFADSAPNAAFAIDPATIGGGSLLASPAIAVTSAAAVVSFRHRFDTEAGWDGGVLEISIGGGAFADITTAGGRFVENGYNSLIPTNGTNNPIGGRNAWTGLSNGFITTKAQLPAGAQGQNVQLRWRFGADNNTVGTGPNPGWSVDSIVMSDNYQCSAATSIRSRADFDGDGRTDLSVFRPGEGNWYINRSAAGFIALNWGIATDIVTPSDFDGDGKADYAIFRPSTGEWYILRTSDGGYASPQFGASGDVPVAGDYDGDGKADVAVFRPSTGVWYVQRSGDGGYTIVPFGATGDVANRADYDGDGKTDMAVFRPATGEWWVRYANGTFGVTTFGVATDKPVPADYDGDGKDDVAVFRPSNGAWYILRSSNGAVDILVFGVSTDIPVPGDYNGDGRDDQAIYRDGTWWINQSGGSTIAVPFGISSDIAIPRSYIP